MKIAMFVFGAIDYSVCLAKALSKLCQIDLYYSAHYAEERDLSIFNAIENSVELNSYNRYRIRDFRNLFIYNKVCDSILRKKYDLIHFQGPGTPWIALYWKKLSKLPLIVTVHDPYQHPGVPFLNRCYQDIMQKFFVSKASKVIVHGETLKNQILRKYPDTFKNNIIVLPHGNFSIYKYWDKNKNHDNKNEKNKNILFFGTIRPNKGLEYLIKAEPLLYKKIKNYKIVIAGKCDKFQKYEKHIKHIENFIINNHFIPNKDVPQYFRRSSIVILPYITATQSGIIPLAYAFGKPVVATNVGAIPEVVQEGKTGFLVEPRNEEALSKAIIKLLSNDNLLRQMGSNALQFSKQNLSWDSIAEKTIKIYSELFLKKID